MRPHAPVAVAVVALLALACLPAARPGASVRARGAGPLGALAPRVFLIIGENTSAGQITPAHAPYLARTLKPRSAWVTAYHSFAKSSSLGDYIAMTSGQFTPCEAHNDLPDQCHQGVDNVFEQVQAAGRTWFEFDEGAANACDIVDHGAAWSKNIYSAHHDPALYYTGVHGTAYDEAIAPRTACRRHDVPMGTTARTTLGSWTRLWPRAASARSTC